MMDKRVIKLHSDDNVAIALAGLLRGEVLQVGGRNIVLRADIACGHKFSLRFVPKGAWILKYGLPIGISTCDIEEGEWVHSHNLVSNYKPAV